MDLVMVPNHLLLNSLKGRNQTVTSRPRHVALEYKIYIYAFNI